MKHTTQELILAAQVRDLVSRRLAHDAPENLTDAERRGWMVQNSAKYTTEAIKELFIFADRIGDALAAQP